MRKRVLLALLAAAAAAGIGGGLVLAGGDAGSAAPGPPRVLARGTFYSVSWGTRGEAVLQRTAAGRIVLRFDRTFTTREAPDLYVYLDQRDPRADGHRGSSLLAGLLKSSNGSQHYDLPAKAAAMTGYLVEIYCAECDKTNGLAKLQPAS